MNYNNNKTKIHPKTPRNNVLDRLKNLRTQPSNTHPATKQKQETKQLRVIRQTIQLNQLPWIDQ